MSPLGRAGLFGLATLLLLMLLPQPEAWSASHYRALVRESPVWSSRDFALAQDDDQYQRLWREYRIEGSPDTVDFAGEVVVFFRYDGGCEWNRRLHDVVVTGDVVDIEFAMDEVPPNVACPAIPVSEIWAVAIPREGLSPIFTVRVVKRLAGEEHVQSTRDFTLVAESTRETQTRRTLPATGIPTRSLFPAACALTFGGLVILRSHGARRTPVSHGQARSAPPT